MSQRPRQKPAGNTADEALDERLAGYLRLALPPLILLAAALAGYVQGPPMAVLVLAAGALFATVAMFWSSLRALFGETKLSGADAFAIGAPSTEEEQKRAVLRAIKDIEFEFSIGKLSPEDYQMLSDRYRAEAKVLLRALDTRAQPARDHAERIAKAHLLARGLVNESDPAWQLGRATPGEASADEQPDANQPRVSGRRPASRGAKAVRNPFIKPTEEDEDDEDDALQDEASADDDDDANDQGDVEAEDNDGAEDEDEAPQCAECSTVNDVDAVFCKKCGTRMQGVEGGQ